jgi:hypothetical protein
MRSYAAEIDLEGGASPRPAMRERLAPLGRYIATPTLAKHRFFVGLSAETLPDHQLIAIARDEDYTFGVLHSRVHGPRGPERTRHDSARSPVSSA